MWLYAVVLMSDDGKNYRVVNVSADRDSQVDYINGANLNTNGFVFDVRKIWFEK